MPPTPAVPASISDSARRQGLGSMLTGSFISRKTACMSAGYTPAA
jgi:hypothetical protein